MTSGKRVAPAPMQWAGCASVASQAADVRRGVTVLRVDEWVLGAQPGAQLLYGIGHSAAEAAADGVAPRLWDLQQAGLVIVTSRLRPKPRDDAFRHEFLAIRTSLPVPPKFPQLPPVAVPPKKVLTSKVPPRRDS